MSSPRNVPRNEKIGRSKYPLIRDAIPLIEAAAGLTDVTKIIPGRITQVGGGKMRLRFLPDGVALRMVVRGTNCTQEFYIYSKLPSSIQAILEKAWKGNKR